MIPSKSDLYAGAPSASSVCAACGGNGRRVHSLEETPVLRCGACGFVFCEILPGGPSPSASTNSVETSESYSMGMISIDEARQRRFDRMAEARHAEYERRLGRSSYRLLEVGCGSAGLQRRLTQLGVDYVGIDLDSRVVEAARRRGARGVSRHDVMDLSAESSFDVVCASQVLEHIRQPRVFVEHVRSLLAPGGLFHCDVPNHQSLAGLPSRLVPRTHRRYGGVQYPHHAFAYDRPCLERLLGSAFEPEVIAVEPDTLPWGQAMHYGPLGGIYYRVSRILGASSLLVGIGRKSPR